MKSYIKTKGQLIFLCFGLLFLQENMAQNVEKTASLQGFSVGFHTSSRGLGTDFRYIYGGKKTDWVFGLRAFGVKDARESKIESQFQERGSRYVYGKLNRLMTLVPYVGIYDRIVTRRKGRFIQVNGSLQVGPTLGLLRPYYLDIFVPSPVYQQFGVPEPQPYNPNAHNYVDIVGVANVFNSGFGPINLRPGLSFRALTMIDFSQRNGSINGLELGANVDYFFTEVPIMAFVENQQLYLSITLGVVFGSMWTPVSKAK